MEQEQKKSPFPDPQIKKAVSPESFVFFGLFLAFFGLLGSRMGLVNMLNTLMNTAYELLLDTVFYIMAIAVLAGAISALFRNLVLLHC